MLYVAEALPWSLELAFLATAESCGLSRQVIRLVEGSNNIWRNPNKPCQLSQWFGRVEEVRAAGVSESQSVFDGEIRISRTDDCKSPRCGTLQNR